MARIKCFEIQSRFYVVIWDMCPIVVARLTLDKSGTLYSPGKGQKHQALTSRGAAEKQADINEPDEDQ